MTTKSNNPSLELIQSKLEQFPPYISRYVHYKKVGNSVANTISNYLIDFRTFFDWLCAEGYYPGEPKDIPLPILEKLRLEDVQEFIECRRSQEAERTVNRRLAALKDLFYYLSQLAEDDQGFPIMRRNVMAKVKLLKIDESESFKANQIQEKILHVNEQNNEIQEFLDFIRKGYPTLYPDNKKIQNFHQKNVERDIAILSLFLDSGLRAFELVSLNVDDVQFKGNFVFLHKGKEKRKDMGWKKTFPLSLFLRVRVQKENHSG
jgi:integrase